MTRDENLLNMLIKMINEYLPLKKLNEENNAGKQVNKLNKRSSKLVQIHKKLKGTLKEKHKISGVVKRLLRTIN